MNQNIRPLSLDEFVGKKDIKENINIFVESAKKRNECLDHVLLFGSAGLGKTTFANIIANLFNKKLKIIQGTQLKRNIDLINLVSLVNENDIIFIDEIHAISQECIETLYSVLEDFCIDIKIGVDNNQKITRVKIPKFTLIGATTNIDKLPKSLEERFPIFFFFDSYNDNEIKDLLKRTSNIFETELSEEELILITEHCKGVPRIANNLLKRIVDYRLINSNISIRNIIKKLGIYAKGLTDLDIKYLKALLYSDDYIGLKTISSIINTSSDIIENKIEPYLLKLELIKKTNRGRMITKKGVDYLEYENN